MEKPDKSHALFAGTDSDITVLAYNNGDGQMFYKMEIKLETIDGDSMLLHIDLSGFDPVECGKNLMLSNIHKPD